MPFEYNEDLYVSPNVEEYQQELSQENRLNYLIHHVFYEYPMGQELLDYLTKMYYNGSMFVPDKPDQTAYICGKHDVIQEIMDRNYTYLKEVTNKDG